MDFGCLVGLWRRTGFAGESGLMALQPGFEDGDGSAEVVAEGDEQIDVVEVLQTREAVGEVVAWVDGGLHFVAVRAEEESSVADMEFTFLTLIASQSRLQTLPRIPKVLFRRADKSSRVVRGRSAGRHTPFS